MKRDLLALADTPFDLLVIGGGILGACIAWDAALRGLSVSLVEKEDFASGTSSNSLKIIHGGLRYLQHLDLRRSRESIRERSTWLRIAPHLVEPLPILLPTYRHSLQSRAVLRAALAVHDAVAWDRNRHLIAERRIPPGRTISRSECLELVPELAAPDLTGGVIFYDAQAYSSERLVLEVVMAARNAGAAVANYVELEGPLTVRGFVSGAKIRDAISDDRFDVRAKVTVNATGPGVAAVAERLTGHPASGMTRYSLALNLMVPSSGHRVAFAVAGESRNPDAVVSVGKRQFFLVPWRNRLLIGTGHYPYHGDPLAFKAREQDVVKFLDEVNRAWPGPPFDPADITLVHSGLIPAPTSRNGTEVRFLKRHRILDHAAEGAPGVLSATTLKFTAGRRVAEHVVDLVFEKLGRPAPACRTGFTPLPGAGMDSLEKLTATAQRRYGDSVDPDVLDHLVRTYGTSYERIVAYRASAPDWDQRVVDLAPVIRAQFVHGVREEMARKADDLVSRRTELGARGIAPEVARGFATEVLAAELRPVPGKACRSL